MWLATVTRRSSLKVRGLFYLRKLIGGKFCHLYAFAVGKRKALSITRMEDKR